MITAGEENMSDTKFNYEKALKKLEEIVEQLEDEHTPLEKSIELFTEGKKIANQCLKKLTELEKKVHVIIENETGEPVIQETTPGSLVNQQEEE